MKQTIKRSVSYLLAFVMVFSVFFTVPFTASAAIDYTVSEDDYYNLISKKDWDIAPGITESEIILNNDDGSYRQVLHVMEADLNNEYVKVVNSYNGMVPQYGDYKTGTMSEQAAYAEANGYGNVVGAMNTTLSWYTNYPADRVGEPLGFIMLDAEVLFDPANCGYTYGKVGFPSVLVINKDYDENGNPRPADIPKVEMPQITSAADLDGWEDQVIPCSSGYILKDGVVSATGDYATSSAPRSVVGIKDDGTVVIMENDGRQSPYSAGMNLKELAETMKKLGCTWAVNCDGGGTSTWLSQRPGEELKVNNSPSDGSERPTTSGILFITTAPSTGEFVRAQVSAEDTFYTPGSSVQFNAVGSDMVGTAAEIPEEATWQISDPSLGTISEDGLFVSNGKAGEVTAQLVYNGKVVGEYTVNIVIPDAISFGSESITVPYGKSVDLKVKATYGANTVVLKDGDISLALSDANVGTLNGFSFTACDEASGVTGGNITATFVGTDLSATVPVVLGKASMVAFDFEENDASIMEFRILNDSSHSADMYIANRENGQVYSGDYSLALHFDGTQTLDTAQSDAGGVYGYQFLNRKLSVSDTATTVQRIGAWIYLPEQEEILSLYPRLFVQGVETGKNVSYYFINPGESLTMEDTGWHYFSMDLTSIGANKTLMFAIQFYHKIGNNTALDYYYTDHSSMDSEYTLYVDDITVDFSSAVDDRENPVFEYGNVFYDGSVDSVAMNGQTLTTNRVQFTAKAGDDTTYSNYSGIDPSSAKVYVDGVAVNGVICNDNGIITTETMALADGPHTVKFEICDYTGNKSSIVRHIVIDADSAMDSVSLVPANPDADKILIGSLYWLNLNTTAIEKVQSVTTVLNLNSVNTWELDNIETAYGFTASYTVDSITNNATITITRTGDNTDTGAAVLAKLPIRTWESEKLTPAEIWAANKCKPVDIKLQANLGTVEFVDGTNGSFSILPIQVDTELYGRSDELREAGEYDVKDSWHIHTPEAIEKAATCTEVGYTGRTYCSVCDSVVEWGTTIPAMGHEYAINADGKLACVNGGELFSGVYTDGKTYLDGVVVADGWNSDNSAYYVDGVKLTGTHIIDKAVYAFDENGAYQPDVIYNGFISDDGVTMYFYNNTNYEEEYLYVDDAAYYFVDGIAKDGEYIINGETCLFEDGKYISCSTADVMDAGWESLTVTYIIYADGSMILGGEGATYKYSSRAQLPWYKFRTKVRSILIGKDITSLGHYALADIYYTESIVFEEGSKLNYIGAGTFLSCYGITEIVLPDSLQTIVQNSFKMCKNLEDVYLPAGVKYLNKLTFVNNQNVVMPKIKLHVYEGTYAEEYAKQYNIPYEYRVFVDSVIASGTCGADATWEFYKSGKMVIGGSGAMDNYTGKDATPWADYLKQIESIEIGKDITVIGNYAFAYATNVKAITFEEGSKLEKIGAAAFLYTFATEVAIPDTVTFIGNLSFAYCSKLNKVYIPQNVTLIYPESFKKSSNVLLNVATGTYAENYAKTNSIAYETREFVDMVVADGTCGENALWTLYASGKMVISGSGAMADYTGKDATPWAAYLKQIKSIEIGKDITVIGNYAFAYATNVKAITFEEGSKLEKIGAAAFLYTYATEVVIPDTVTFIGNLSFAYCSKLNKVYIPQNVTLIYPQSFKKSSNVLLNVATGTYAENYAKTNGIAYETREFVDMVVANGTCGENALWTLYASGKMVISGSGAMANYTSKDATPWAAYLKQIKSVEIGKDITVIGNYAFAYATNVKAITFEEGSKLERIGSAAFLYTAAAEVILPETVTYIGNSAFAYCSKLVSISVPASVKTMFNKTFNKSSALTLIVEAGSYAEKYAIDNSVAYTVK